MGLDVPAPDTVVLAKVGDQTTRHLEVHEFQLLVDAIPKDSAHRLRDRALLEVLFATGCRLSELCGLTRRRVNLKTREVEVIGKGKKARGTFLTDEAADWLQRYLNTRRDESPHVFISSQSVRNVRDPKTGQKRPTKGVYPLSPRQVETIVSHLALRAGLPEHFSPHWFRHGRLTIMARHSGLLAAQELAGHASPQTTRRYTRITSSELKKHFDDADREERRS
jgi:integrase/recombinase XerD